jgi:hypothetical protein
VSYDSHVVAWLSAAVRNYANLFLTRAVPSSRGGVDATSRKMLRGLLNGAGGVVAHTETLLVSDHPVCAGCGGSAAFSYWRSLPSS